MVATQQAGHKIAEDGVNPLGLRHIHWLTSRANGRQVATTCFCDSTKAGKAIGEHRASQSQIIFYQSGHCLERESRDRFKPHVQFPMLFGRRHGCNESNLVLQDAPELSTSPLTAEVGITNLDFAFNPIANCTIGDYLPQLVLNQPSGWVTQAQLAIQCQGRQSRLGLADQVNRQKKNRQW